MHGLKAHYEGAFANAQDGNIYQELSALDRLAHERRVMLLDALPLPDLSTATVVDYGVGAWGVGAVFQKLKSARRAIGIDISSVAVAMSAELSSRDPAFAGRLVEYHTATGYALPLTDESVDVFFSGECIEHIEDTDLHLSEVHRVLKPGGIAIFTTPNSDPWIYRQFGLRWCVGFEHVALMSTTEIVHYLECYFNVERLLGFNQSFHPTSNLNLIEVDAKRWVNGCENNPTDATSLIAMVSKQDRRTPEAVQIRAVEYDEVIASSPFMDLELTSGFFGRMVDSGGRMSLQVPVGAVRCNLILWSHAWSGHALVRVGDVEEVVDLYSHVGGCRRVVLLGIEGATDLTIAALGEKDLRSHGCQVIIFRAVFAIAG